MVRLLDKSFSRRYQLNSAILENRYHVLPVESGHENYVPVGRGVPSSSMCGKHVGISVCKNLEEHKGVLVDGRDCTDKVVVRHKHLWCHRSLCPICFIRGWSVRGAGHIEARIQEGVNRGFGKPEHVVVSLCSDDYGLSERVLREKARLALKDRGVVGGCMILHGYSMDRKRGVLKWTPHYHCLGFIKGGFDRCRECVHVREDCAVCSGFKGREMRGYKKDGIIVKVLAEREKSYYGDKANIFGTAFYQLNHATVRVGVKRFHAVTWFGICGNRKYGTPKVESVDVCPACNDEMTKAVYVGSRHIVKDIGNPAYEAISLFDEFDENGKPNFIEKA